MSAKAPLKASEGSMSSARAIYENAFESYEIKCKNNKDELLDLIEMIVWTNGKTNWKKESWR